MRRHALGIIALVLLGAGAMTALFGPGGSSALGFAGSSIKAGVVLGALWLALPQIEATFRRLPRWLAGWFTSQGQTPDKTEQKSPPAPTRRPRRRSTS